MGIRRNVTRQSGSKETYSYEQSRAIVKNLGIDISGETSTHLICYCPFHHNTRTPAFSVDKTTGEYYCFNPDCGRYGDNLVELTIWTTNKTEPQARRFVMKKGSETQFDVQHHLQDLFNTEELPYFPQMKIDELKEDFWNYAEAKEYMYERGFNNKTLSYFDIGYSPKQEMVVVPVYHFDDRPVGIVGRAIEGKRFKNSTNLPRNHILYNLNNAKQHGGIAVITESSFDAMRVHQAGFPNVVALLGSNVSQDQYGLLDRFFDTIIIMTDADKAGRKAGRNIVAGLRHKSVMWAVYELGTVYPDEAKDAGDMTDSQIKHCIENAISDFEYWSYKGL